VASGAECGRPSTATGPPDDGAELLLVTTLVEVAGVLLLDVPLEGVALLADADELIAIAVEDAGLAVPPTPAQPLATARTSTAAVLAPISLS